MRPGVHILRHTFCSHLAMRGATARAIQEPAGHQDLSTTQRYMHLSRAPLDSAIRLLDEARPAKAGPYDRNATPKCPDRTARKRSVRDTSQDRMSSRRLQPELNTRVERAGCCFR